MSLFSKGLYCLQIHFQPHSALIASIETVKVKYFCRDIILASQSKEGRRRTQTIISLVLRLFVPA